MFHLLIDLFYITIDSEESVSITSSKKMKTEKERNKDMVDKEEIEMKRKRKKTLKFLNNKKETIIALIRAYKTIHVQNNFFFEYLESAGRTLLDGLEEVEYQTVKEEINKDMEVHESYQEISKKAKEIQITFEHMMEKIDRMIKNISDK